MASVAVEPTVVWPLPHSPVLPEFFLYAETEPGGE
jgi:hypothetical protein